MGGNILNSVPVVGHVKGMFHFMVGDLKGGSKAFFEATRSTAVMAGGAAGAVAGPAGIAAGAVAAGMVADFFKTAVTGNAEGVLAGITGIVTDISNGEVPIQSVAELSLCVAGDVVGGIGGAFVTDAATKTTAIIGKKVGKEVTSILVRTVTTHALTRAFTPDEPGYKSKHTNNQSNTTKKKKSKSVKSKDADNSLGSGADPPDEKQNKMKKEHYEDIDTIDTHWNALFKIFNANSLDDICMGITNVRIFKDFKDGQRKSLKKLIGDLRKYGDTYFRNVVKIVAKILDKSDEAEVTFQNFVSLTKFVMTYVGEKVAQRNDERRHEDKCKPFQDRLRFLMEEVTADIVHNITDIYYTYRNLILEVWFQIDRICPSFHNDVAAVNHYYKHRLLPEECKELSVEEYFNLIQSSLQKLKTLQQFSELSTSRREVVYETYIDKFGRRLRTVVKNQGGNVELSSSYFLTAHIASDKEGDEYLDGKKVRRWLILLMLYRHILYYLFAFYVFLLSLLFIKF